MPDPSRARGGDPRVERRTDSEAEVLDVLYSDTPDVIAWVEESPVRARRILSLELERPRPRRFLVSHLRRVADAAGP